LNGRNAATLIRMVPGVVSGVGTTTAGYANSSDTIAVSVNGTRGNEVSYRLDGATHMDNVTNLNAAYPNPDALQEFHVQTSKFSAQYGNFSGAVVNLVTRSGSNPHHGSRFALLLNSALSSRTFVAARPAACSPMPARTAPTTTRSSQRPTTASDATSSPDRSSTSASRIPAGMQATRCSRSGSDSFRPRAISRSRTSIRCARI